MGSLERLCTDIGELLRFSDADSRVKICNKDFFCKILFTSGGKAFVYLIFLFSFQ